MSTDVAAKHLISEPSKLRHSQLVFSRRRRNDEECRLPTTLELLVLSLEHMTRPWVTLEGVSKPLCGLRPSVLQQLQLGKAFQQHQPLPVMANGRYMNASRQSSLGYGETQRTASKWYGTSYKNVAHHHQGPCRETPPISGNVRLCLHDFLIYAHTPPDSHVSFVMNALMGCSTSRRPADIFTM